MAQQRLNRVPRAEGFAASSIPRGSLTLDLQVLHEQSQAFTRPLLGGRLASYRVHRYTLPQSAQLDDQLANFALSCASSGAGVTLSNIGGFHGKQDLFDHPEATDLRDLMADCVRSAAAVTCADAGAPQPREGSDPYAWANVSYGGNLNQLHSHPSTTLASCYYAKVPQSGTAHNGTLLFRLTVAEGCSQAEPDEDRHVPWMAPADELSSVTPPEGHDGVDTVFYAELEPKPGTVVVFPAWLSHSVAPTVPGSLPRVSFAANWDFQTVDDDYPEGWKWFSYRPTSQRQQSTSQEVKPELNPAVVTHSDWDEQDAAGCGSSAGSVKSDSSECVMCLDALDELEYLADDTDSS